MTESHTQDPNIVSSTVDVGKRLRETRESKKISVNDAAAQLRMTREAIEHLEQQQWEKLHGRTYARGYFLSYVKFLGLPQDEMLAGFNEEYHVTDNRSPSVAPIQQVKLTKPTFPWFSLVLAGGLITMAWIAYQLWQTSVQDPEINELTQQTNIESSRTLEENTLPISNPNIVNNEDQPELNQNVLLLEDSAEAEVGQASSSTEMDESPDALQPSVAGVESVYAEAESLSSEENLKTLIIGLNADCWVEVRDADQSVLISRVVRGGNTVELVGQPPLHVALGQASAASIRFENEIIDISAYIRGNVARFTLGSDS